MKISVRAGVGGLTRASQEKKKSKLACPRSPGLVMHIGRTCRKAFSVDRITMKGTREAKPREQLFFFFFLRFCYQTPAVLGSRFKWHML